MPAAALSLPFCPGAAHTNLSVPGLCPGLLEEDRDGIRAEPGRISRLEPSPGGKGSCAAWRAREGQRDGHVLLHPGFGGATGAPWPGWEQEHRGARQRQPQILLLQSLWIIHRGAKGVRSLQAVFCPTACSWPAGNALSCLERPRALAAPALGLGFGEMRLGPCTPVGADAAAPGAAPANSLCSSSRKASFSLKGFKSSSYQGALLVPEVLARGLQDLQQAGSEGGGRGGSRRCPGTRRGQGTLQERGISSMRLGWDLGISLTWPCSASLRLVPGQE